MHRLGAVAIRPPSTPPAGPLRTAAGGRRLPGPGGRGREPRQPRRHRGLAAARRRRAARGVRRCAGASLPTRPLDGRRLASTDEAETASRRDAERARGRRDPSANGDGRVGRPDPGGGRRPAHFPADELVFVTGSAEANWLEQGVLELARGRYGTRITHIEDPGQAARREGVRPVPAARCAAGRRSPPPPSRDRADRGAPRRSPACARDRRPACSRRSQGSRASRS